MLLFDCGQLMLQEKASFFPLCLITQTQFEKPGSDGKAHISNHHEFFAIIWDIPGGIRGKELAYQCRRHHSL